MTYKDKTIGLALSGGGYRATLFGLGSLLRLNELGLLKALDRITSVSGGSILAGYLGYRWHDLRFTNGVAENFDSVIASPIRNFCTETIDISAGLKGIFTPFRSAGDFLVSAYDKGLFKGATLHDLPVGPGSPNPTGPAFILYATNLQTGRSFRFMNGYVADYYLGINRTANYSLALAVAASSAFPPIFSGVKIKAKPEDWVSPQLAGHPDLAKLQSDIQLGDGGIYDNMGLQALIGNVETILVSDAGAPFTVTTSLGGDYISHLGRVRDILIDQTRALRKSTLIEDFKANRQQGTYWGISTEIAHYQTNTIVKDSATTLALQKMRTRLNAFNETEQGQLINWGYALCDAAIRKHIDPNLPAATGLPFPQFPL